MLDYYKLLSIDREISEEELYKKIRSIIGHVKTIKKDGNLKEKIVSDFIIMICENFMKNLEHYGSKEKYDKALRIKYEKRVKFNKKFFNGKVGLKLVKNCVLVGVIIITLTAPFTLATTEVPVYNGYTLEQVAETYNVPVSSIVGEGISAHITGIQEDGTVIIISSEKNAEGIEATAEQVALNHKKEDAPAATYGFYYIVKSGDTATGLAERYDLTNAPNRELNIGEKLWLETTNPDIAEEMELQYQYATAEPFPIDYENYEVEPGDNLGKISEKFGVSIQMIVKFNNIENIGNIKVGDKLIIVRSYVEGKDAYLARLEAENKTTKGSMS